MQRQAPSFRGDRVRHPRRECPTTEIVAPLVGVLSHPDLTGGLRFARRSGYDLATLLVALRRKPSTNLVGNAAVRLCLKIRGRMNRIRGTWYCRPGLRTGRVPLFFRALDFNFHSGY